MENTRFLVKEKNKETEVQENLDRVMTHLNSIILEIRLYVHDLRPLRIEKGLLSDVIQERLHFLRRASSLLIDFSIQGEEPEELATQLKEDLLLIINESLTNAIRHARSTKVQIMLIYKAQGMHLSIHDNGIGISTLNKGGFGIASMIERASRIGGTLTIASPPEGGTKVEGFFPY
ncbi:sensor histidine kinase, putative [Heliorestis convoluta]|uniref:Sensor histidine kinase, putative n=1 Tax=Heliorestis convoluta TaxID=356322 RepID=A0A5Q2N337_9FIRM|nr:sensor histidine kinase, putative [Heliorestis convoluta]